MDGLTLEPIETPEIKTEYGYPGNSIGSSDDGNHVAVGDTKGTVTLFDAEKREKKWYVKAHKNKSAQIKFTTDNEQMVTLGLDKQLVYYSVENNKNKKLFTTSGQGEETRSFDFFNHNGIQKVYVGGTSCAVSEWTV